MYKSHRPQLPKRYYRLTESLAKLYKQQYLLFYKAQSLAKIKTRRVGADGLYTTKATRKFAVRNSIQTDFKTKGSAEKDEHPRKQLARTITKE